MTNPASRKQSYRTDLTYIRELDDDRRAVAHQAKTKHCLVGGSSFQWRNTTTVVSQT